MSQTLSSSELRTIWWQDGALHLLDQTLIPQDVAVVECKSAADVAHAIRTMQVRGAPAIGVSAAYGLALAAAEGPTTSAADLKAHLENEAALLRATRPTAVNLGWALDRQLAAIRAYQGQSAPGLVDLVLAEAKNIDRDNDECCQAIGDNGAPLVPRGGTVLTHCNTGPLACGAYGTALGVILSAYQNGNPLQVLVDETRPRLQGARLTAWELQRAGVPSTLIADNMAASMMRDGKVDMVVVGADRIAANGDTANKIGTYSLAVISHAHGVPFYVAAPTSTVDLSIPDGGAIPIEQRDPQEMTRIGGQSIAPEGVKVYNPAFDVTPANLITAIITEKGVIRPPFADDLRLAVTGAGSQEPGNG